MFSSHDPQLLKSYGRGADFCFGDMCFGVLCFGDMCLFRKGFKLKISTSTDLFDTVLNFPYETNWIEVSHFSNCSI